MVILSAGGLSIQDECTKHIRQNGELKDGDCYVSASGSLNCSYICHAVGPIWQNGLASEEDVLYSAVNKCMEAAYQYNCRSISFPVLCAGNFGMPLDKAALALVKAIRNHLADPKNQSIVEEVFIVDKSKEAITKVESTLIKELDLTTTDLAQTSAPVSPADYSHILNVTEGKYLIRVNMGTSVHTLAYLEIYIHHVVCNLLQHLSLKDFLVP